MQVADLVGYIPQSHHTSEFYPSLENELLHPFRSLNKCEDGARFGRIFPHFGIFEMETSNINVILWITHPMVPLSV